VDVYLVGGAVRDELLGREPAERDWVVVGSSPEELTALGYRQVGRDFPVFLHPTTREEYALARTERKSGPGHLGFVCHAGPDVTLEQDLLRRDLTINAMARDPERTLVDPFGGAGDLAARVLRHVSDAFVEDPLRLFRVARFAAQLPDFTVAPETRELLRRMAAGNELAELSAERVWGELEKALAAPAPQRFFEVLADADAWLPWFAEFLHHNPAHLRVRATAPPEARFATYCSGLSVDAVSALSQRLHAPRRFQRLAEVVVVWKDVLAQWHTRDAAEVLDGLTAIGAFASNRDAEVALAVIESVGTTALDELRVAMQHAAAIRAADVADRGLEGPAIGAAIREARERVIVAAQRRPS
jgi:tRNA nucleotidyltransferase (CCA-adding enzyme)